MAHNTLGAVLQEMGLISEAQLNRALAEQKKTGDLLGKTLVKLGFITEDELVKSLSKQLGIPLVKISDHVLDTKVVRIIPEDVARKFKVIAVGKSDNRLRLAMIDPFDVFAIDRIEKISGRAVEPVICTDRELTAALDQYYEVGDAISKLIHIIQDYSGAGEELEIIRKKDTLMEELQRVSEETPIIKIVNLMITQAVRDKASDIHVEPDERVLRVRYRIDGILHEVMTLPKVLQPDITSRVKIMAEMDIAKKRVAQDGRFQVRVGTKEIDFRVSTMPTVFGESVVLRLLDKTSAVLGLEQLGFVKDNLERFKELILRPYGIILVTGPTGSGKTTTLYGALQVLNTPERNIVTVEEPVEYQFERINQVQVNALAGVTFENALRNIVRQDPDVIMVGEIRDHATAAVACQAALTGHLVFSTLHTNDAPGAIARLIDLGVEPFLIASSVIGVMAQRLVRTICSGCKESYKPLSELLKAMKIEEDVMFVKGKGCQICKGTGYKGRTGIFELMIPNDFIRELIIAKSSAIAIREAAIDSGMRTLRQDGIRKVLEGTTSVEEVFRATQEEET